MDKPHISPENIKRLFYGSLHRDGLLNHLKECHLDASSIKSKAILNLFRSLMDNNQSHQVDEMKTLWRSQKPSFVQDCHLEDIIHKE